MILMTGHHADGSDDNGDDDDDIGEGDDDDDSPGMYVCASQGYRHYI